MGVLGLWEALKPVRQNRSLTDLEGQTLSVDLSGWVCENMNSVNKIAARNLHIRNLFFRVSYLLRAGVKLVFVTEGVPPDVKGDVLSQRIASQYGSESAESGRQSSKPSRKKFDFILKGCQKMLQSLGVPCIQSSGEAEALCAYLNKKGLVDGILSEDGDCFLYGGLVVYRNFTMDTKDPHVEMYKMDDIETKLNLDRRKLVALALLTGCDYAQKGIPGIGRELALKCLNRLTDLKIDPLERFRQWKTEERFTSLQDLNVHYVRKSNHCEVCNHPGTTKTHQRKGCEVCETEVSCNMTDSTDCSCEWHKIEKLKEEWGAELKVMEKAVKLDGFPNEEVIKEFLMYKDRLPLGATLEWSKPDIKLFQEFMGDQLQWTDEYGREKCLPLLSMWYLTHHADESDDTTLSIVRIVKERKYKGVPSFDVEWKTMSNETVCLIEPKSLVAKSYPSCVEKFIEEKEQRENSKKKSKKIQKKKGTTSTSGEAKKKVALRRKPSVQK